MLFIDRFFGGAAKKLDKDVLPLHIAIIMDGNGRWAQKRGLPRNAGHREGSNALKRIVIYCSEIGIRYLTVYAFSTENWKRPKSEVDALMELLREYLSSAEKELAGKNVVIRVIGDKKGLPKDIQDKVSKVEKATRNNTGLNFNIALNYGSRGEIVHAVKEICRDVVEKRIDLSSINEKTISDRLYTSGIPDPDLLIRTSGEQRISNFLLWQSAYTEFWYTDVLWPDFKSKHLLKAIREYCKRHRRFGGI